MNHLVEQANCLLQNQPFEYAICGGHAIDLFLGMETRKHSDIDILAYWADRDAIILYMKSLGFEIYEMLGGGRAHHITDVHDQKMVKRNIFCCKADCELVQIKQTEENEIFAINFQHLGQSKLNFIEFLFNDKSNDDFLYARNHEIKRNLSQAILFDHEIPFLAPELCLLYKSTDIQRAGYQQDYDFTISKMSEEQKQWLNLALDSLYPQGHQWK